MHVAVPATAPLSKLDDFLRHTWLECCGHLSAFEIGGKRYASEPMDEEMSMRTRVSEVLEVEDPIKGNYTLEVSSPGFDRILRKRAHFERFVGERIAAELKLPLDGRRRFVGTLKSVGNDSILVEVDGRPYELPLERIQKARLRPE